MCGISGVISTQQIAGLGLIAQRLRNALTHRGPDDRGIYFSPTQQASLIHTRLSILDRSSNS